MPTRSTPAATATPRIRLDGWSRLTDEAEARWPTLHAHGIDAPAGAPLTLAPREALVDLAEDGRLGGLRLPPWLAVDDLARVLLLSRDGRVVHRLNGGAGWIPLPLAAVPEDAWAIHSAGHRVYVVGRQQLFVYDPDGRVLTTIEGVRPLRDSAVDGHGLLLLFADGALARLAAGAHWLDMLPPAP
ncbi:MAG: hypothetical protein AAF675_17275, partial [Pseudomonadota bacterium]